MNSRSFLVPVTVVCLVLAGLAAPRPGAAAWPHYSAVNVRVATASGSRSVPQIMADGRGGAILCWADARPGDGLDDIYAARVTTMGGLDAAWPLNGRAVCTATDFQSRPVLAPDGQGGAIIAWEDRRGANYDIYAHHLKADGTLDAAWPANGRAICTAANYQRYPAIASDRAGGAIIVWEDFRNGTDTDIYAQHLLSTGVVDPGWSANGIAICAAAGNQHHPALVCGTNGWSYVVWDDARSGTSDIYAERVYTSGTMSGGAWALNGLAVCTSTGNQVNPVVTLDDAGTGALVAWEDYRGGATSDVYVHRLISTGKYPSWPVQGTAACAATGSQYSLALTTDGDSSAVVAWQDERTSPSRVFAMSVTHTGALNPTWPANGLAVTPAGWQQVSPRIVPDGGHGTLVVWQQDAPSPGYDIYAQHLLQDGIVDTAWAVDGEPMSTASGEQVTPVAAPDGRGGVIAAWLDARSSLGFDVYAQRVEHGGQLGNPEPGITGVRDVPGDQGGQLRVSWTPSYFEDVPFMIYTNYLVYSQVGAGAWQLAGSMLGGRLEGYSLVVHTAQDSTGGSNPYTRVKVVAQRQSAAFGLGESDPDSGYSTDNLPPSKPGSLVGNYSGGVTALRWGANAEPDFWRYRLYRGSSADFGPAPANLVAEQSRTDFADALPGGHFYKLCAVDVHGNQSPFAVLTPQDAGTVPAAVPAALWLGRARPNPARGTAWIAYGLPRDARVTLAVYGPGGKLVRRLEDGLRPAGEHSVAWDGRDADGRGVASGAYFYRLETEGRVLTGRLALLR
jgi:hypothetical protein